MSFKAQASTGLKQGELKPEKQKVKKKVKVKKVKEKKVKKEKKEKSKRKVKSSGFHIFTTDFPAVYEDFGVECWLFYN